MAQKNTAPESGLACASKSFVLNILHVTRFNSRFCKDETGSIEANTFISKILQKWYIKNIFDHSASPPQERLHLSLCVE